MQPIKLAQSTCTVHRIICCPVAVPMCVHMKVLALTDRDLKLHMMNESAKDERFFLSDMCNFVVPSWIGNTLVQCFNCEL